MPRPKIRNPRLYFEIVQDAASGALVRWSLVWRMSNNGPWENEGLRWTLQGPYDREGAEPVYMRMIEQHGQPVRRMW